MNQSDNNNFVRHFYARKLHVRPLLCRNLSQNTLGHFLPISATIVTAFWNMLISTKKWWFIPESDLIKRSLGTFYYFPEWPELLCVHFHVHKRRATMSSIQQWSVISSWEEDQKLFSWRLHEGTALCEPCIFEPAPLLFALNAASIQSNSSSASISWRLPFHYYP